MRSIRLLRLYEPVRLITGTVGTSYQSFSVKSNSREKIIIRQYFWLKLMISEEERSFLLVIDFTGDRKTVFAGISDAAVPFLPKGYYLDMIPYEDSLGQQAATGEPYYKRQ